MSKRQILMLLGVLTMILLYLGFPDWMDKIILLVIGAAIAISAYSIKGVASQANDRDIPYVDHKVSERPSPTQIKDVNQPIVPGTFS